MLRRSDLTRIGRRPPRGARLCLCQADGDRYCRRAAATTAAVIEIALAEFEGFLDA